MGLEVHDKHNPPATIVKEWRSIERVYETLPTGGTALKYPVGALIPEDEARRQGLLDPAPKAKAVDDTEVESKVVEASSASNKAVAPKAPAKKKPARPARSANPKE